MRIVMNGLAALKPKTGVGHHVADLYGALASNYPDHHFSLYPGVAVGRAARALQKPGGGGSGTPKTRRVRDFLKTAVRSAAKMASRVHFAGFTRAFRFDLYHEPNFVAFPTNLPTVITVHDLSVLKFPDWHPRDRVKQHQKHFLKGLGRAQHVIVVSESVRRELIDELNCPKDRVTAVHNGIGEQFVPQSKDAIRAIRTKWNLPEAFFLCVGTIEPRKNLATAMRAYLDLPATIRDRCPMILAGPWGWHSETEREIYDSKGKASGIRHIGYVPADDLPALYSAARALLYPSHYEGFGFPPLEMRACGGAVLASTAEAVREVLGSQGHFLEAEDTAAWREAMKRTATDEEFVERLRAKSNSGVRYCWARAAAETFAVYRKVLGVKEETTLPFRRERLAA